MPAIRSILLHLDASAASATRLVVARLLAERHDARVTALFGVQPDASRAAFAYSAGAALQAAEAAEAAPYQHERDRLRALWGEGGPECAWYEVVGDTVTHGFLAEAAYADLLVLGRQANGDGAGAPAGFVESAILDSGIPALVVPHPYRQATTGNRVLLAWNGSAQAARAMSAALPFLSRAAEVHVATWASHPLSAPYSRLDVTRWLERHGIASQLHQRERTAHVAADLAAMARQLGVDLVAMGCYGHSRLRERMLGGVTRSMLATLPVPVLMAH